ncbi:hypothetical protein [Actinoplanes sp. NPDC051411]|uniref:hypothetical protein n=1 Tax=Actinoplanes sp. NPDC051411 TaxID=3155522 RepID=UPI003418AC5A
MSSPQPVVRLDRRLLSAGLGLTVATLVRLWADHTPPVRPTRATCRTCGHAYTDTAPLCPTAATVRPLLVRRRYEGGPTALDLLTSNQIDDLLGVVNPRSDTRQWSTKKLSTYFPPREDLR